MAAVPQLGRATQIEGQEAPEAAATHALYERYGAQVLRFCAHQLGSREEAEDAAQTTFMNAFRGLQRGIEPECESAWLFAIAQNVCLTRRRSTHRRGRVESPNDLDVLQEIVPAPPRSGADELFRLQESLAEMPDTQRRAILLREWQGLSYREIAEELELTQAAVETLIFRARRSLARNLEQAPLPPAQRRALWARARRTLDLGSLFAALKGLAAGAAAVKAAATTAAAVTVVAAVAADTERVPRLPDRELPAASAQATPAPAPPVRQAVRATSAAAAPARAAAVAAVPLVLAAPERVTPARAAAAERTVAAAAVAERPAVHEPEAKAPKAAKAPRAAKAPGAVKAATPARAPKAKPARAAGAVKAAKAPKAAASVRPARAARPKPAAPIRAAAPARPAKAAAPPGRAPGRKAGKAAPAPAVEIAQAEPEWSPAPRPERPGEASSKGKGNGKG